MDGRENSSNNPELSPQNSTISTIRMSSQQRPLSLSPQGALELSQWRAHLASEKSGTFPARINEGTTSVKLDPDGPEAQETWERLKARGKSLLNLLTSQATPVTTNGLRYDYFSHPNQGYQNIKPFDVLLSHAFRTQEASTSTQFTFGTQQSTNEQSISTPAVYFGGGRTHHVVAPAGMAPKTQKSPWKPPTSSAFQPASPSTTAIMALANGNSTLRRLLGHEIQPPFNLEEELKEKKTKLQISLDSKQHKSTEISKAEDGQQPYIDPRLTCILRANLSEPLNRRTAYPMPSYELIRKRPAPVHLTACPTTCGVGIIRAKHRRTLGPSKELTQASSSHAHVHSATDAQPPRMPFDNTFSGQSSVIHAPPNLAPHSTILKGMKFGIVAPNNLLMTSPPTAAGSSAQRSEHAQEENGPLEQTDAVVPSSGNQAKSQRDGMIAASEQTSIINNDHVMLVTIPTTQPAQQSNKPAQHHQNHNPFQAVAEVSEPTSPEETAADALTTPLVNLENIQPHTISQLREAGVSAMALLMSNGAIVGIPIISLDDLNRSLPTWGRLCLAPEEDGSEICTSSNGKSTEGDDADIDVG